LSGFRFKNGLKFVGLWCCCVNCLPSHISVNHCITAKSWISRRKSHHNIAARGSMLWSQFSAIFANFRQRICRFSFKKCYDLNFAKKLAIFCTKTPIFWAKIFQKSRHRSRDFLNVSSPLPCQLALTLKTFGGLDPDTCVTKSKDLFTIKMASRLLSECRLSESKFSNWLRNSVL
jgi:hypothetical protein